MRETTKLVRAAQYVRMSTDQQIYSTANQADVIAAYAELNGFEIVRTYADEGRSGLKLKGRSALQQLLADVLSESPEFNAILVYDVSRWGRFQDVDESAHYEFLCRNAGVPIHYCAETFRNDGSLSAAIMKSLKRVMAGEYSRELSAKVFQGQVRLARQGYKMGGGRRYGFRRMLVDGAGEPKGILQPGEQKHLRTDHVILVPGPDHEIAVVKRIFALCARKGLSTRQIARQLNGEGRTTMHGLRWTGTTVAQILRSDIYTGVSTFGRFSKKLGGRQILNDRSQWIRCVDAFEPLVDRRTFDAAQRGMAQRKWSHSDEELLAKLRALYLRLNRLTVRDVLAEPGFPTPPTLARRFGSFRNACALAGAVRPTFPYTCLHPKLVYRACSLLEAAQVAIVDARGRADLSTCDRTLIIDGQLTLGVTLSRPVAGRHCSWRIRLLPGYGLDVLLVALLPSSGDQPVGYALLPAARFASARDVYISENRARPENNRFTRLSELYDLVSKCP